MAPEQFLGAQVDARTDQFSFCVVLYELLYNKRPFSADSLKDLLAGVLDGRVKPPPDDTHVPKWLHSIVVRGLSVEPDERYPSLATIVSCADVEALRAPVPLPKTKVAKAKIKVIRDKLAEVTALEITGKYRLGLVLARKLEKEAQAVAYPLVQAEVLYGLGILLDRTGDYQKAETTLYAAARTAGASRDGRLAAKALSRLIYVAGYKQARHNKGLSIGRATEVVLDLSGGDDVLRAKLFSNMGVVFFSHGKYDKALKYFRKSLAIMEKTLGREHPKVAQTLTNMGNVLNNQGKPKQALEPFRRAVAICDEKMCDPEDYGIALFGLARALVLTHGDREHAIRLAWLARKIFSKTPKKDKKELESVDRWLKNYVPHGSGK